MVTTNTFIVQSDWANVIALPANIDYATKIKPSVLEAQQHDLRRALGVEFYAEVCAVLDNSNVVTGSGADMTQQAYDDLLPYLKWPVLYFAHARYIAQADTQHTQSGLVKKETAWSSHEEQKNIDRRAAVERSKGTDYITDLVDYLSEKSSNYLTWKTNQSDISQSGVKSSIKFSSL